MLGDPDALENRLQALIGLMQQESIGEGRAIDNAVLRDRLVALQAEVAAMKCNGMRILSNQIKGEPGGLAKLIVKIQACELAHQISALAIDAKSGRAHVCTPVTNAHIVCRRLLEKNNNDRTQQHRAILQASRED